MKPTKNLILLASFVAVLSVLGRGQDAGIAKDNKATTAEKPNNDGQTRPPAVEAGDRAADNPGAVSAAAAPASASREAGVAPGLPRVPPGLGFIYPPQGGRFVTNRQHGAHVTRQTKSR